MESDIKEQLIKSVKNIKNKLKLMREEEDDLELKRRKLLKPITDPLEAISAQNRKITEKDFDTKTSSKCGENFDSCSSDRSLDIDGDDDDEINEFKTPIKSENVVVKASTPYLKDKSINQENKALNVAYGVRNEGDKLMIGNAPITLNTIGDNFNRLSLLTMSDKSYEVTPGLSELLFQSKPNIDLITEKDKLTYKDILIHTNAHKRGFNPLGQIRGNSGSKYCQIIKPLFFDPDTKKVKQGGSLPILKKYKSNTDLIYWDDPNELIDRLKILVASKDAGNTNHDNEIISIIEELKEAGIIKE